MPELPEVETVKKALERKILNKTIFDVEIYRDKTIITDIDQFKNNLKGQTIVKLSRKGKFLIFHLTNDLVIISHLRMEGKFFLKNENDPINKHDLVIFKFSDHTELRYNDTRRFGILGLYNESNYLDISPINKLGKEPFEIKKEDLIKAYKNKNVPIKQILLDQSIMCGLGNIYCDEVLFESKIHPLTLAKDLNELDIENIINNSVKILNKAISLGGSTIHSYQSEEGINGEFQINLKAYGNENKLCPNCQKELLRKIKINGRGTTYCPNCQRNKSLPFIIGVTGPVGCGKSTVAKLLSKDKYQIIDADKIVHELYSNSQFVEQFRKTLKIKDIYDENIINRDLLRKYLLIHPQIKNKLEKFVWKKVEDKILSMINKCQKDDVIILDVPLLFESKLNYLCDKIVLIYCSQINQIKHLKNRNINDDDLIKINQNFDIENKKKKADYIINNNGSIDDLKNQLNNII